MDFEIIKNNLKDVQELEVFVSYDESLPQALDELELRKYSDDFKKRVRTKLKQFRDFKKREGFVSFYFQTDLGQNLVILLVKKNLSTHGIQLALRRSIISPLKEASFVRIWMEGVSKFHQETLVENFVFIETSSGWKSPLFGKRQREEKRSKEIKKKGYISSQLKEDMLRSLIIKGKALAEGNNLVRTLAVLPSNYLTPTKYQEILQERAQRGKYIYRFIDQSKLKNMKAGAFLAVMSASPKSDGGIAHLSYRPKNKSLGKICLVGKGICFDTGGYNIKTGNHMYSMHRDMTGSAVVLALFETLAKLQFPFEVHGLLAIAENYISESGYKPNDIVETMNGTSIEVVDTDAEGRMVLSDTLCFASELKPNLIIDYATLTGSAVRAIGTTRSCVFSNNKKLSEVAVKSGDLSGERVWSFPINEEYRDMLDSDIADIKQCIKDPGPDHILAATFLSEFVDDQIPWLHVDLSSEENKGGLAAVDTEVTGFGVRLGLETIQNFLLNK